MKTYNIRLLIGNFREPFNKKHSPKHEWIEETITGNLSIWDNYYQFKTDEGKSHYYPINYTIITEI